MVLERHHHRLYTVRERGMRELGVHDRAHARARLHEYDETVDQLARLCAYDARAEHALRLGIDEDPEDALPFVGFRGASDARKRQRRELVGDAFRAGPL